MIQESEIAVKFHPSGRTVFVLVGTKLYEAAAAAGLVLEQPCGGQGLCGKCRAIVRHGAAPPTPSEHRFFSAEELAAGWRLACQTQLLQPSEVEVPGESLVGHAHKILTQASPQAVAGDDPPVRKLLVEMAPPRRGSDEPDVVRLTSALDAQSDVYVPLGLMRELPARLRQASFCGTAVLAGERLLDFQPGDTTASCYAVATDVGTTTLVSALVDTVTGEERAVAAQLNPQARYGDDVLSRIVFARDNPRGLAELQQCVVAAIDQLIGQLCAEAGVRRDEIFQLTFSGNTTMQHLLCAIDPQYLAVVPFVPVLGPGVELAAAELGFDVHPQARAYLMPVIGGFVGGDTVAGILATGLADAQQPTLLVDIGTNGEIVVCAGGKLWAASTAAGPAFEGARISRGMRGSIGAIEKVVYDGQLRINVIGNVRPKGLCGSGLIDAAAELLRHGLLAPSGKLLSGTQLPAHLPPDLVRRVVEQDGQPAFMLASEEETADGQPILLTQQDIRQLQLATGAIRAGVTLLLHRAGLQPSQLQAVLLAGGFGNFIRRSNAQRIGLLPPQIERRRIRYQGNTSLAGARLAAMSLQARQVAEQIARQVEHVDLSTDPAFHSTFAASMIFPESCES